MKYNYTVREIHSSEMEYVYYLRASVWREIDPFLSEEKREVWIDSDDGESLHYGVFWDNRLVASAKGRILFDINIHKEGYIFADQMAVLSNKKILFKSRLQVKQEHRKRGLANLLDEKVIARAIDEGCQYVVVVYTDISGENRRKAFEGLGFQIFDPVQHCKRNDLKVYPAILKLV